MDVSSNLPLISLQRWRERDIYIPQKLLFQRAQSFLQWEHVVWIALPWNPNAWTWGQSVGAHSRVGQPPEQTHEGKLLWKPYEMTQRFHWLDCRSVDAQAVKSEDVGYILLQACPSLANSKLFFLQLLIIKSQTLVSLFFH